MRDVHEEAAFSAAPESAPPTTRDSAAAALAYMTKLFERSSQAAKIGVWECNLDGEQLRWTDVVYDIFDLPRGAPLEREAILNYYTPDSRAALERVRAAAIARGDGFTFEAHIRTAKGREKWIRITASVESDAAGPVRIFGLKQDITDEKTLVEKTRFFAEYDSLTGLANRSLFQARLADLVVRPDAGATLLLVDLDGFKEINDGYGHAQGDRCLAEIAARLKRECEGAHLVARVGGDEFAVLYDRMLDAQAAARVANRIVACCREPVIAAGVSMQMGASVGVATIGQGGVSEPATFASDADLALYAAKAAGKSGHHVFHRGLRAAAERRRRTIHTIGRALDEGGLELFYQPKVRLVDGRLHGFEALLRRRLADGRADSPSAFIAALEDADLSRRIGRWVVSEAIDQAARWRRAGLDFRSLSINAAAAQLRDPRFVDQFVADMTACGVAPTSLEIEITEGVFLGDERDVAFQVLTDLRARGVRIAVDDFGTGYASLVHLRNYPIDVIKIDRSFVSNMLDSSADLAILECMLDLGVRLGKDVVVEGVETAAQAAQLRILGARLTQGFHYSHALPARAAERFMRPDWRWPCV